MWTERRLNKLFEVYRLRYWPQSRRLLSYRARMVPLETQTEKLAGRCDYEARELLIDSGQNDRDVRATLLHEMVHAVVGRWGHHAAFWTQLEYLLRRGAPITVGFPELGEHGPHLAVIPARFRRCRQLFAPAYRREQRRIEKLADQCSFHETLDLETECKDAASEGVPWRAVWAYQVKTWGFVDLDGRLLPWARKLRAEARRGYIAGRRFFLSEQRLRTKFLGEHGQKADS